jgi:hypothetical protein
VAHPCTATAKAATQRPKSGTYERHRPEETVLFKTLQSHWRSFLAEIDSGDEGHSLPAFVIEEVQAFLRCGILAQGLTLARCRDCGWCRAAAFSCQRRGFCPSCIGRKMCDFAARVTTQVIPRVPVRQWVLTLPHALRAKIAFDPALTTVVLREFIAAVSAWLRRRARRLGIRGPLKTGAVTVIQRFNSAIELSPHLHALVLDGLYSFPAGCKPVFHPTPSPTDEDIAHVAAAVFRRVERKLADREPSPGQRRFAESAALLLTLGEASAQGIVAAGPRRGCRVIRIRGAPADIDAFVMGRLCAQVEGYNVQAATRIAANDDEGLERMARYLARPPIATDRLTLRDDGRLELRLKRRWRDGTTAFLFHPQELIARLVALVPRPRAHLVRYSGVLAPAFFLRSKIVPAGNDEMAKTKRAPALEAEMPEGAARVPWAPLLWRVLGLDVLKCERCSGRMRIVTAVTSKVEVARILESMELPTEAPSFHAARPPPQEEMSFDGAPRGFEPDQAAPDGSSA